MQGALEPGVLFVPGGFGVPQVQMSEGGNGQLPDLVLVLHFLNGMGELVHCYLDCLPLRDCLMNCLPLASLRHSPRLSGGVMLVAHFRTPTHLAQVSRPHQHTCGGVLLRTVSWP
jgi:hypothetical protein